MNKNVLLKKEVQFYKKLLDKKYRHKEKLFIIEGENLIYEALKYQNVIKTIITSDENFYEKFKNNSNIKFTSYKNICLLSSTKTPQKSIAICNFFNQNNISGKSILVLNKINDPGNLGTLIRTAHSFGVKTVIVEGVDIYNPKVLRSSQGSIFNINIFNTNNLIENLLDLKKENYKLVGSLLKDSQDYRQIDLKNKKIAIILGNEANGIEEEVIRLLDYRVYIPIEFESLNVSIAGGILLSEYCDK